MRNLLLVLALFVCIGQVASAADLEPLSNVEFKGDVHHPDQLSAVATLENGEFLVLGADEGVEVQVLRLTDENEYTVHETIRLIAPASKKDEIDIEGIACDGEAVYVVGSHSRKRSKVKPEDKTQEENRKRLSENELEPLRETLFRFELDSDGNLDSEIELTSLRKRIDMDEVLKPFIQLPSKENGIDIEGVAIADDGIAVAFRGPVLRGGFVPVLFFEFDEPEDAEMIYVNLGGRGVRDIARVEDGFLLIGGPVGDEPVTFELYHWDGEDCVPGTDVDVTVPLEPLGQVPVPDEEAKVEGLVVLNEANSYYDVLVVYDGVEKGNAVRFRVAKDDR